MRFQTRINCEFIWWHETMLETQSTFKIIHYFVVNFYFFFSHFFYSLFPDISPELTVCLNWEINIWGPQARKNFLLNWDCLNWDLAGSMIPENGPIWKTHSKVCYRCLFISWINAVIITDIFWPCIWYHTTHWIIIWNDNSD